MTVFWDPVIRAPLLGSMLLSLAISWIGVLLFIRRRTLSGEVLSHASYPGVAFAIFLAPWVNLQSTMLVLATCSALIGFWVVHLLQEQLRIKEDAALCFVLATFFGMGTLVASVIQVTHPAFYRDIPLYLYGQAATIQDEQVMIYAIFTLLVGLGLICFYRPLLMLSFDRTFAASHHINCYVVDVVVLFVVAIAVVMGMRSLGVILLSALMVAPPTAARQFTHRLPLMFLLSGLFGVSSGCAGTLLSLSGYPTGPCIVLIASGIALLSLCFAPERGIVFRWFRILSFRLRAQEENALKALWRGEQLLASRLLWWNLCRKGWVDSKRALTPQGLRKGAHIVRLHRLWEAYLVSSLGMGRDQVHHCAEEMEHVLTPELEQELEKILADPTQDPHAQPIPTRQEI